MTVFLCCLAFLTVVSVFDYIEQTFSVNSRELKVKFYFINANSIRKPSVLLIICFFCNVGIFTIIILLICNNLNYVFVTIKRGSKKLI